MKGISTYVCLELFYQGTAKLEAVPIDRVFKINDIFSESLTNFIRFSSYCFSRRTSVHLPMFCGCWCLDIGVFYMAVLRGWIVSTLALEYAIGMTAPSF